MSYILVTYGYNQFGLFNIKTSTPTLIDKIKENSFLEIRDKLQKRDQQLTNEIQSTTNEEEKLHKTISSTEQDLQNEEYKYQEALRAFEEKKKREEMEQKKKEAKEAAANKKAKGKKEEKKSPEKKPKGKNDKKKETEDPGIDDKPITLLKEKLAKYNTDLATLENNKKIYNDKKKKVEEYLAIYKKKFKERMSIKIDLVDAKGEKINIFTRGDTYANEYLVEKTVYELHSFNVPTVNAESEKDSKKNTKKDFKKADNKKTEKDKGKDEKKAGDEKAGENKEGEVQVELVLEPVKIDGYCFRSIKEDEELEETAGDKKDKKAKKK